jgi:hypothetical protein
MKHLYSSQFKQLILPQSFCHKCICAIQQFGSVFWNLIF